MSRISDAEGNIGCVFTIIMIPLTAMVLSNLFHLKMSVLLVICSILSTFSIYGVYLQIMKRNAPKPDEDLSDANINDTPALIGKDRYSVPPLPYDFNACSEICSAFVEFILKSQQNNILMHKINEFVGIRALDRLRFGVFNPRLFTMVLHDTFRCYKEYGHSNETQVLCCILIFHRAFVKNPLEPMPYSDAEENYLTLCKAADDIISAVKEVGTLMYEAYCPGIKSDTKYLLADTLRFYGYDDTEYTDILIRLRDHIAICDNSQEPVNAVAILPNQELHVQAPAASLSLDELIGLNEVKSEVRKLSDFIRVQQLRADRGLPLSPINCHCVFTGNPGTGKTTVARILADIFKELGILKKGHVVETDRSGLVAEYVGQTAAKTNEIVDKALDGVLFIDEAYSLIQNHGADYGNEAIATLLKRMEDERDRLIVILAGYDDEMQTLIDSNPGLRSRFNRFIHFDDYSAEELWQIFSQLLQKNEYVIDDDAAGRLRQMLCEIELCHDKTFGNARFVRNLLEKILENQAARISAEAKTDKVSLQRITIDDVNEALTSFYRNKTRGRSTSDD